MIAINKETLHGLLALCLMLLLCVASNAQGLRERQGGVYYAYHAPEFISTDVPQGYHPFYISHYGRHGSRWLPSDSRYEWVNAQFADSKNLTIAGKRLKKKLQRVWKNARGNGGKLTPLGAEQHRGIARRMYSHYSEVFASGKAVDARSSVYDRCAKSMQVFCKELREQTGKSASMSTSFTLTTDSADMAWIAYTSPELKLLEARTKPQGRMTGERLAAMLFKDTSKVGDVDKLLSEIHTIASDMQDIPLDIRFDEELTEDECQSIYNQNNLRMWTCNGLSPANYGIPARSAISLWRRIVSDADAAISQGDIAAHLRFGHDTNLYRLLSLMGAGSLSDEQPDHMDEVLPMAANLQLVFYTNGEDVLVKVLHNEQEVMLIPGFTSVFMRWDDMKKYVDSRIGYFENLRRVEAINTMVGTDYAVTKTVGRYGKGSEEHGQTIPAVQVPNGMNSWTPQTRDTERKCVAPYYYGDTRLQGFRNSHWIVGGCTQDYGTFTLMPLMDSLRLKPEERGSRFSHTHEVSHPDYYSVVLPDEHLKAEMTGLSHSAMFRFTFSKSGRAYIVVNPNSDENQGFVAVDSIHRRIYGYNPVHRIYQGWGEAAGFNGWFVVEFNQPFAQCCVSDTVAWVAFDVSQRQSIMARAGSSFIGYDGAVGNIQAEMPHWQFERARRCALEAWQQKLHRIEVEPTVGDSLSVSKRSQFDGALYRTAILPRTFSDCDGRYPSFAGGSKVMQLPQTFPQRHAYMDFSMWDTYRALHPLNILIEPAAGDMMASLVRMYQEGGWLPIFPCWNSYTAAMIGDHSIAALADAMVKNTPHFDEQKAYEAMRKNAFVSPATFEEYQNGMGRRALDSYLHYGYIPMEDSVMEAFHTHEQVSRTLEYAYDDFALAQVALKLGRTADYLSLMKRAANWRNAINPITHWADGRYRDGRWLFNTDQEHRVSFITEGATCHYTWYVPHDPYGLMQLMGGAHRYVSRLDSLFTQGLYWHGNEPCHQVAYMFNYAGEPWRTQQWVSHILATEYLDAPGGLSGNDDAGQLSAWYVFSSLGFYPVCPATPYYLIGAPTFPKARIGRFVIEAANVSPANHFIQSATWNGQPYTRNYITHQMILQGGTLRFVMGPSPNYQWGNQRDDCPPDVMKLQPTL